MGYYQQRMAREHRILLQKLWEQVGGGDTPYQVDTLELIGTVTTEKIASGAVTNEKVNASAAIEENKLLFDPSAGHSHNGTNSHTIAHNQTTGQGADDHHNQIHDNTDHSVNYSSEGHNHTESDITDLGDYADENHAHTENELSSLTANLGDCYADETEYSRDSTSFDKATEFQITRAGWYLCKWEVKHQPSTGGSTQIYLDGTPESSQFDRSHNANWFAETSVIYIEANQYVQLYFKTFSPSYYIYVQNFYVVPLFTENLHKHTESDITNLGTYADATFYPMTDVDAMTGGELENSSQEECVDGVAEDIGFDGDYSSGYPAPYDGVALCEWKASCISGSSPTCHTTLYINGLAAGAQHDTTDIDPTWETITEEIPVRKGDIVTLHIAYSGGTPSTVAVKEFTCEFTTGRLGVKMKTASCTITHSDQVILVDPASPTTISLPTAVGYMGITFTIKAVDLDNSITIDPNGSETIDGASTYSFSLAGECITIVSDGGDWFII